MKAERQKDSHRNLLRLLGCIQELANKNSNPVLEILDKTDEFQFETKYPENLLTFGGSNINAYYHAHGGKYKNDNEHGHFHIFIRGSDQTEKDWSHVAGLSMDREGQPQQWFTVNHWVTGGAWKESGYIIKLINELDAQSDYNLVESWIICMIILYTDEIRELLINRDNAIHDYMTSVNVSNIHDDHTVYYLSECQIQLQGKIASLI